MAADATFLSVKREFRSYFVSPIAYIVIAVFLVVTGWVFFSPFFLNNRADLRDFFSVLPLILCFVVPAITMKLFSDEYQTGTFEITRTLPLSLFAVVAGKFMAAFLFVLIMLAPTVSYAIFTSAMGNLDWGAAIGGYVGAALLGAMYCAIGLFSSALSKNQIVAYVIGIAFCAFFTLIDRSLYILPGEATGIFQYLAADYHFQNIAKGIFDTRDLVYFISLGALALYGTSIVISPLRLRGRSGKTLGLQVTAHVVFVGFLVVLNVTSGSLHARADLTQDRIHSLSPVTVDTVSALQEPVTVRAFFSSNLPAPYNSVEQSLRDVLSSYALVNPGQFNYAFYSMTKPEEELSFTGDGSDLSENQELALDYGIMPIQIQQIDQDEMSLTNAYMGLAVLHGDSAETLGALTSTDQLEFKLTSIIQNLAERSSRLLSLDNPISVELYLSSSIFEPAPEFIPYPADLGEVVEQLNVDFFNQLSFVARDPYLDPDALERARDLSLPSLRLGDATVDQAADQEAYASVVINLQDENEVLNLISVSADGYQVATSDMLKEGIEATLNRLLTSQLEFGYMVGNGTPPYRGFLTPRESTLIIPNLSSFYSLLEGEYDIRGFFAANGVPEGLRSIMIVNPREPFTDYELFQIDQFLMRGGSVFVFQESYDMEIMGSQSRYSMRRTGLEDMIEHYGVRLQRTYLLDENCYVVRDTDASGTAVEIPIYSALQIPSNQINQDFGFLRNINDLVLVRVAPLQLTALADGVQAQPLLWSSERSWLIPDDPNITSPLQANPPEESQMGSYPIAYLLEGEFESYFAGRPIPAGPTPVSADVPASIQASSAFIPRSAGGKLFVMGTASVFEPSVVDPEENSPASLFLLNSIDYMNGREGIAEVRARGDRVRPLRATAPAIRRFTKVFNIAGLPILVILAGLGVWIRHRVRRRRVRRMFAGGRDE